MCTFVIANPNPLVWEIGGTGAVGFFGAAIQFEKYKQIKRDIKAIDVQFSVAAFVTDNENTMKSLRTLVRENGDEANGCGPHAGNKALGMATS